MKIELSTERMLAEVDEHGIGRMVFNSPAKRNALSLDMWQGVAEILEAFEADPGVRVAVMSGAGGKAFVSGADISEFDAKRSNAEQRREYGRISARGARALTTFRKPLIAEITGYCIGGGLATALDADIRFATPDSTFGIPAAKLGLGYQYGGLAKLARMVGPSRARDILLSARFLDAEEALAIGLINFIVPRDEISAEVTEYAQRVAANAPLTVAAAKAAVDAWEAGAQAEDLARVQALVDSCFDSEDYREGRRAFAEKRKPVFRGV